MIKIKTQGIIDPYFGKGELAGERLGGALKVREKGAVRFDAFRGAAGAESEIEVAKDDIIELVFEGDFKLWVTAEQYRKDFAPTASRGQKETDVIEIPSRLTLGSPSRGVGEWILKGLRVLKIDVTGEVAKDLAKTLERKLIPKPGLYRCGAPDKLQLSDPGTIDTTRPLLVFIHGTASSTEGSFGALWGENNIMRDYLPRQATYKDSIFAFQHHTLTQSPIQNAIDLVQSLPKGAKLHLVTHSRGGLIGELVCRGSGQDERTVPAFFDAQDTSLFPRKQYPKMQDQLGRLSELLKEKNLQVERFVRVACPARGTTLASGRLDRWLSIMVNLVGMIPGMKENPVYECLADLLLAVVKERTDPKSLPGLEAMMPESAFIKLVNRPGVTVDSALAVISGDIEGSGLWDRVKLLIPDLFYGEDHDFVVNTASMYGGVERRKGVRYFFDQGPEVNHFHYFINKKTAIQVVNCLLGKTSEAEGFMTREERARDVPGISLRRDGKPRPVVFLVPGIMGTHLSEGDDRIWIDPLDIATGGFERLGIDATDIKPEALVGSAYADLADYLSTSHEVVPFPYDWRKSIEGEALRLGREIEKKLDYTEKNTLPLSIIAHSMGGLVARAMILKCPQVWRRIILNRDARLIMLGTPTKGSFVITRLLVGQERVLKLLGAVDIRHTREDLLKIISLYPGVLEMLPNNESYSYFDKSRWAELFSIDKKGWIALKEDCLEKAYQFRKTLDNSAIDPDRMFYVAGRASATPIGLEIHRDADEGERLRFIATTRGDGRVPWDTGIPRDVKTWYMKAEHGDLAACEEGFSAIKDILVSGNTSNLPSSPPIAERGAVETFTLDPDEIDVFPDRGDLADAALGTRRRKSAKSKQRPVKVCLSHGDLGYAQHMVVVGHYEGDSIVSAEAYLDSVLDGQLRRSLSLGIYPGELNTSKAFFNPRECGKPKGAVIAGLGKVGELSPCSLSQTLTKALLNYANEASKSPDASEKCGKKEMASAAISALLIGTGAGGMSVEDSLLSILLAVRDTNEILIKNGFKDTARIAEVELIEIMQDRVIEAGRALHRISVNDLYKGAFKIYPIIKKKPGARARIFYQENPGWWQRLQITSEKDGSLRFSEITDKARAEVSTLPTQRALVDKFIDQATGTTAMKREVCKTLFEMLVPNRLKEQSRDRQDLMVVLDSDSAHYPWELLEDRSVDGNEPLSVQHGFLRRLETDVFREKPAIVAGKSALVVGNPKTNFTDLPGAKNEAIKVCEILRSKGYTTADKIDAEAESIVLALHAEAYRILHLAGHGVFEYVSPKGRTVCNCCGQTNEANEKFTGMVIGEDLFFTPADAEQLRQVPEVVFINCCHLGAEGHKDPDPAERLSRHKLAANLASQFIRMGVRAVIAAGWAVDDAAASTFAQVFYQYFLGGTPFGKAVLQARKETFDQYPSVNTWGAYQCYGDPDFILASSPGVVSADKDKDPFVSPDEVVSALDDIAIVASSSVSGGPDVSLRKRLEEIEERIRNEKAFETPAVSAAFGRAYGEIRDYQKAVEYYRQALKGEKAEFPLKAAEQYANLLGRMAVEEWRRDPKKFGVRAVINIKLALKTLNALLSFADTAERLCLVGSAYKRMALISRRGVERKNALKKMMDYYHKANALKKDQIDAYAGLNWLTARILLAWSGKAGKDNNTEVMELIKEAERTTNLKEAESPDFWNSITLADCGVVKGLVKKNLDAYKETIISEYQDARKRGATPREFGSVLEHIEFLIEMVETYAGKDPDRRKISEGLKEIYSKLTAEKGK